MALNARQSRFVQEYLLNLTGTDAAIAAGYAPKHANRSAFQLLAQPEVAAAIAAGQAAIAVRNAVTAEWIVEKLKALAQKGIKGDSVKALELLGKNLSMFKDRLEHSVPGGGPIPGGVLQVVFVRPPRYDESSDGH